MFLTTKFLLLRHAQSLANSEGKIQGTLDSPLSHLGHTHAQLLAKRIADNFDVQHIFSSPLLRAVETAEYLSDLLTMPFIVKDSLKEQAAGPLTGLTKQEIKTRFPQIEHAWQNNQPRPKLNGAETEIELAARVKVVINEILTESNKDSTVAIFSHGGTINQMLRYWLNMPLGGRLTFTINNASLSIVTYSTNPRPLARLFLLNGTCHLGEADAQRN